MNLFENIVDVPHLDTSIDTRRYNAIPISNGQCFQLNYSREVRVQYFYQFGRLERPNVQIFSKKDDLNLFLFFYKDLYSDNTCYLYNKGNILC